MNLKACYEDSRYQIVFDSGSETSEIVVTYGQEVNLGIPEEDGKEFIGWFDAQVGGNMIIDSSGMCIWNRTNEIEHLFAQFVEIQYTITYVTSDGQFVNDNSPEIFTVSNPLLVSEINEVRRFGYVFDKWTYNDEEFISTEGIYQNIILYARWLGTVVPVTTQTNVTEEFAIINMKYLVDSEYVFYIYNNVKSVTFISYSSKTFTNMRIIVNSRTDKLVMGFQDMNFYPALNSSGTGKHAINTSGNFVLEITFKGDNYITGGAGGNGTNASNNYTSSDYPYNGSTGSNGNDGYTGGYGIYGYTVHLNGYDNSSTITITGGKGGNGGNGGRGQNGADGVTPPNGSFVSPNQGDSGTKGGNGGTGGKGGNGGYAIYVRSSILKVTEDSIYNLTGGAGGTGGKGGTGGTGGDGTDDVSANIFNGVGDPGDGGNGGNGGNGGRGGNGSVATNASNISGTGGKGGAGGAGGSGGYGGSGGDAGAAGDDGSDGSNGSKGSSGSTGGTGTTGSNSSGGSGGYIPLEYSFSKDNFVMKA